MGKIFVFCWTKLKFCSWIYKKCWHTSWKFQLDIRRNKKVIAKMPLTNLNEMNSRSKIIQMLLFELSALCFTYLKQPCVNNTVMFLFLVVIIFRFLLCTYFVRLFTYYNWLLSQGYKKREKLLSEQLKLVRTPNPSLCSNINIPNGC